MKKTPASSDGPQQVISISARLRLVGINPYIKLSAASLREIFDQAGRDKSPIPIKGEINGQPYTQNLVRHRGEWRLYVNTLMLKNSPRRIGEEIRMTIVFDSADRTIPMHLGLAEALNRDRRTKDIFDKLRPSLQKEIIRYISALKTEDAVIRNIARAMRFLQGKERFIGRDKP